jgi:hypothetical protein
VQRVQRAGRVSVRTQNCINGPRVFGCARTRAGGQVCRWAGGQHVHTHTHARARAHTHTHTHTHLNKHTRRKQYVTASDDRARQKKDRVLHTPCCYHRPLQVSFPFLVASVACPPHQRSRGGPSHHHCLVSGQRPLQACSCCCPWACLGHQESLGLWALGLDSELDQGGLCISENPGARATTAPIAWPWAPQSPPASFQCPTRAV